MEHELHLYEHIFIQQDYLFHRQNDIVQTLWGLVFSFVQTNNDVIMLQGVLVTEQVQVIHNNVILLVLLEHKQLVLDTPTLFLHSGMDQVL